VTTALHSSGSPWPSIFSERRDRCANSPIIHEPLVDYVQPFGGGYLFVPPGVADEADYYGKAPLAQGRRNRDLSNSLSPDRNQCVILSVSNWANDAYYDDDAWLQPVTYDQTDHQGVDPNLVPGTVPSPAAAGRGADDPGWDNYAGYDDFGNPTSNPAPPPGIVPPQPAPASESPPAEAAPWQPATADEYWTAEAVPWQPAARLSESAAAATASWRLPPPDERWMQEAAPLEPRPADGVPPPDTGDPDGRPRAPRAPRPPRWLILGVSAVTAAAVGFGVVVLAHRGHQSLPSSALPSATTAPKTPKTPKARGGALASPATTSRPPLTSAQAQQVLANYTTSNNSANAQSSTTQLAAVEGGSSLAIDSGIYAAQRAGHAAPYPPYHSAALNYYIPLEPPATYPHWFAVRVANAELSSPGKVFNTEYMVFTQAAAGAPWLDSVEPFSLPSAAVPPVALDGNGYATAVSSSGTPLALSPAAASTMTATALDSGAGQPADPGNLADEQNLASFKKSLPSNTSITSSHSASTDPAFGLRTTDGGALLFYDVAARLTLTAAPGSTLGVSIPGFVSPGSHPAELTLNYLDQFATVDPPAASGTHPQVIADYSGLVGSASA
jgi:hypothetical protein